MSEVRLFQPSNGTDYSIFEAEWCAKCALFGDGEDNPCMINLRALAHKITDPEYPAEWQYSIGGVPSCTAFTAEAESEVRCDRTIDMFGGQP